jgi:putative transposase
VILTIQLKLLASAAQVAVLKTTLTAANAACDWISEQAWITKTFSQVKLHHQIYKPCRTSFPALASQIVIRANAKVVDAYKLDKRVQRKFRTLGCFPYDARLLSWNLAKCTVSIWSLAGRLTIPFVCGPKQYQMLFHDRGEADLVYRKGSFYMLIAVKIPDTEAKPCESWLGVDLGLVNLAADSDGKTYGDAKTVAGIRKRRWRQRKRLQSKCTRSAKRVLKRLRGRETRFVSHENHVISKQICAEAKRTGRGIGLEFLKRIRSRIRASKGQRRILHSWAFADLQSKIAYKCRLNGIPIKFVDPRNTSRSCPACGHVAKANRKTRDRFECVNCGFTADADTNAARIISRRAAIDRPYERDGVRAHVR